MDLELLVRLMQMQMASHTIGGGSRGRGPGDANFALILAAVMDTTGGAGGVPPIRRAAPAVKAMKATNLPPEVKPGARANKRGARNSVPPAADLSAAVDRVAEKFGLDPSLLRAVVQVESDFDPGVVSRSGAMGLMQLMPETARHLGVKNPFDPVENLEGGARYLKSMIERFSGNLRLALAAYNAGPGAVDYYGGVPPYEETESYLKKINMITGGLIG